MTNKTVLITGITGFAGSHLAEYIINNHPEVKIHGTKRYRSSTANIIEDVRDKVHWHHDVDYTDAHAVTRLIRDVRPDWIFHLSANSFVPASWGNPNEVITNNIQSQINIFEAVSYADLLDSCRIQIACSSEEYGMVFNHETPINEFNSLRPLSPYGVSKVAQDLLGYQYYKSYGLDVVRTRAFNHTGARRGHVFVCSTFAKQIAEIEAGLKNPVLHVGNLDAVRDFTDVRDMVRAYWNSLKYGESGEVYNIGTGHGVDINYILTTLLERTNINISVEIDAERNRPSDVPILICDSHKFRKDCNWKPEYGIDETLQWILDYWRKKYNEV